MSLFPAYETNFNDEENRDKYKNLGEKSLQNFCSFVPTTSFSTEEEKNTKESLKNDEVKIQVQPEENSDVEILSSVFPDQKSGKKKEKTKKRKRRKPKPDEEQQEKAQKWAFLNISDPFSSKNQVGQLFVYDRKRDLENLQFGCFYKGHIANYKLGIKRCLGASEKIEKILFPPPKDDQKWRYFSRKSRKIQLKKSEYLPAKRPQNRNVPDLGDFIEFHPTIISDSGGEKLVYDPEIQMYRPRGSKLGAQNEEEERSEEFVERAKKFNKALDENPHDVDLWLSFLEFQDLAYGRNSINLTKEGRKLTDLGLLERKMSILDKAVAKNPTSIRLKLNRLKIGSREGVWDREKVREEWRNLEFHHLNQPSMWDGHISFCLDSFGTFRTSRLCALYDRCVEKLGMVLSGKLATHAPLPQTEEFILECLFGKAYFLLQAGFREKALASLQALVEFNFFQPWEIENLNLDEKKTFFEPFWDSLQPRFADFGALGWKSSLKSSGNNSDSEFLEKLNEIEDKIFSEESEASDGILWSKVERLRSFYQSAPWRSAEEPEDPDRIVLFDDISGGLVEFKDSNLRLELLARVLEFFGANLIRRKSSNRTKKWNSLENLLQNLESLPSFESFAQTVDSSEFLERAFQTVLELCQENSEEYTYFVCSKLNNSAEILRKNEKISKKSRVKEFKKIAKDLFRMEKNRNCIPLYAVYAEKLLEFGSQKEAAEVALTTVKSCKTNFLEENESAAGNLVLIYIESKLGTNDGDKSELLTEMAEYTLSGKISNSKEEIGTSTTSLVKARKKLENVIIPKYSENYIRENGRFPCLGSNLVHWTAFFANFVYCLSKKSLENALKIFNGTAEIIKRRKTETWAERDLEILLERKLRLINFHARHSVCYSSRYLRSFCEEALAEYPTSIRFLKVFVDLNLKARLAVNLRRYLDSEIRKMGEKCAPLWLAAIYAEFSRYLSFAESVEGGELPEIHRLRNVLDRATDACPNQVEFWRFYLKLETMRGQMDRVKDVFYRAVRHCSWAKDLYLDLVGVLANETQMAVDIMVEKEIRIRLPLEELQLLKEAAKNDDVNNEKEEEGEME